ncbi:MAG TPA: glycosyltransferase family 87 protein [Anaerolineales bacterium]|nr:glycosyltransferase family 87 protein [Anaerolineales bacterium]
MLKRFADRFDLLRTWWADYGTTLIRYTVSLMTVVALVWLGYQFWRLLSPSPPIWSSSPVGAVDMMLRHDEVHRWFSERPVYSELNTAVYPPASFVLLWPLLGWLSVSPARWLWAITTVISLGWLIYLVVQESGAETPLERVFVALIPLAIYPTGAAIGNGQLIVLILPALVAGLVLIKRKRGWREDILVAVLILFTLMKPSLAVPFFWIVLFVPGTLRPAVLVSLGYLVLTLFAVSFQDASLLTLLGDWSVRVSGLAMNGGYADLHSLLKTLGLEHWSLPASLLVLIALGTWIYRHRQNDLWLLLGVTALVARSWTYHRWYDDLLILLPMVALFRVAKQESATEKSFLVGALLAVNLLVMLAPGGLYLLPPPWNNLYVAGQFIVWTIDLVVLLGLTQRERSVQVA